MKIKKLTALINSIANNNIETIKIKTHKSNIIINKEKVNKNTNNYKRKLNKIKTNKIIPINTKEKEEIKIEHSHLYSTIVSPMVGTFYESPGPNEASFIEIGEIVKPKQTVCIIEAMKLMNEIEAEVNGEIVEILVKDGDIVDCGQALIKIKKNNK